MLKLDPDHALFSLSLLPTAGTCYGKPTHQIWSA